MNVFLQWCRKEWICRNRTYSFVITAATLAPEWNRRRMEVRQSFLTREGDAKPRQMEYKGLNDTYKSLALPDFLKAADALHGLCLTVAVAKDIKCLSPERIVDVYGPDAETPWNGNENAFERAQLITHFVGLLVGGLSGPGQHLDWVTDRDEIVCKPQRMEDLKKMVNCTYGLYASHYMGGLEIRTNERDPDMFLSDFLAIPDLIAGCFSELLNHCHKEVRAAGPVPARFSLDDAPEKVRKIIEWHMEDHHPLQRVFLTVDPTGEPEAPFLFTCPTFVKPKQPPSLIHREGSR